MILSPRVRGLAWLVFGLALAPTAPPAAQAAEGAPGTEGPLQNDSFLPVSEDASLALAEGDGILEEARAAGARSAPEEAARLLAVAFDAWHGALEANGLEERGRDLATWWDPTEEGTRRLAEGLGAALRRRLAGLTPAERRSWSERFGAGSEARLAEALATGWPDAQRLAELVRLEPGTAAAARGALILSDLSLEAGHADRAREWATRAARRARALGRDELAAAADRRLAATGALDGALNGGGEAGAWTRARSLEPADSLRLLGFPGVLSPRYLDNPTAGVRPGAAVLDPGRLVVQTPGRVHVVRFSEEGELTLETSFEPDDLLGEESIRVDRAQVGPGSPGWALLPAAGGGEMVFVHGRTDRDDNPNALVAVRPADPRLNGPEGRLPTLLWTVAGDLWIGPEGEVERLPELEGLASPEFQPGPLLFDSYAAVALREAPGTLQGWLAAFDRNSGRLLWLRRLAQGSDLVPDRGRFAGRGAQLASQAPLALVSQGSSRIFAGTHLGTGSLVDALDGELLWTVQNRRRDASLPGWDGARPLPRQPEGLLWAPSDSDRLYSLRTTPLDDDPDLGGLFLRPPQALGRAKLLAGGSEEGLLVLGNIGRERALTLRRPGQDRIDALYLGPEERFRGRALVSEGRVLFATNRGVYLCDRGRELYLLDYATLSPLGRDEPGGDLLGLGNFCLVVGREGLWSFRTDP